MQNHKYKALHSRLEQTHQTLRARVDDADKQETDREPRFGVLHVERAEGYYPEFLDGEDARHAYSGLNA